MRGKINKTTNSVCEKLFLDTRVWLHIDTPFLWVQTKRLQCPFLTESLQIINNLRTSIVSEFGS